MPDTGPPGLHLGPPCSRWSLRYSLEALGLVVLHHKVQLDVPPPLRVMLLPLPYLSRSPAHGRSVNVLHCQVFGFGPQYGSSPQPIICCSVELRPLCPTPTSRTCSWET